MAMQKRGRLSEADFQKMDDNDPRKKRWQQVNKKYGEQGRFQDKKKAMEAARGRAGGSSADTTNKAARAKQLASDYATSQQDKSKTASQGVQDRRQALSSRSSDRSSERKDSYATAQSIQQDRRRQMSSSDYSASQRQRDQQDRNRGAQKRGHVSEGAERMSAGSMDRQTKRVDRVPLSETTEVETELHSGNRPNIPSRIEKRQMRSENVKNRRDHTYRSASKERDSSGLRSDSDRRAALSGKNDRGARFIKDFTSKYER